MLVGSDGNIQKIITGKERMIRGSVGKSNGLAHVLWERGL